MYIILIDLCDVVGVRLLTIRLFIFDDDEDSIQLSHRWKCKWWNLSEIRLLFDVLILAGVLCQDRLVRRPYGPING